jgi:3D (Asp-Asp-Asp) domain-containing protein
MKEKIVMIISVLMILAFGFVLGKEFVEPEVIYIETPIIEEKIEEKEVVVEFETEPINYKTISVTATAYCPCKKCCGKSDGITATGVKAKEGRTIAADPKIFPYGTKILIDGNVYTVEDCGSAIKNNKVDIFFESHEKALDFGVQYLMAYVKGE